MDKDKIKQVLTARYKERSVQSLESVTADVFYSGEPAAVLASDELIDKLFTRFEARQSEVEAKKNAGVDTNEFCPICKMATSSVKLAEERSAKWCSRHFVVFPVKGEA